MNKIHNLNTVVIDHNSFDFFYIRIQCDKCGNSRFRVFIIDPDGPAVHETIFKCQEFQIPDRVKNFVLENIGIAIPF
jgi:hypothetical protein